jgi:hypothetical protein
MSHFAEIDDNNIVLRVLVGDNNAQNEGLDWFLENLGGRWIKTSYNGNFRKRFAGIGMTYNEELDAFVMPQLFDSWTLNQETADWEPPVAMPTEGFWEWNEDTLSWTEIAES